MPTRDPAPHASWVRRHRRLLTAAVVALAAGVLTWALGGFDRTTPDGPVRGAPGAEVDAVPFVIRLDRAEARYVVAGRQADPGLAFVVVEGTLRLSAAEAVGSATMSELLRADLESSYDGYGQPADEPEPAILVEQDGSALIGMGPGLTYDVLVTYVVDEADVPDQLRLAVQEQAWRRSSIDETLGWHDPETTALVTLDVAPLPDERPAEEEF